MKSEKWPLVSGLLLPKRSNADLHRRADRFKAQGTTFADKGFLRPLCESKGTASIALAHRAGLMCSAISGLAGHPGPRLKQTTPSATPPLACMRAGVSSGQRLA